MLTRQQELLQSVYKLLLEAAGHSVFPEGVTTQFSSFQSLLGMAALHKITALEQHTDFLTHYLSHSVFVLDQNLKITTFCTEGGHVLGFTREQLHLQPFERLVASESKATLEKLTEWNFNNTFFQNSFEITLCNRENLLLPSYCFSCKVPGTEQVILSLVTLLYWTPADPDRTTSSVPTPAEQLFYEKLHYYIRHHLDSPLPPIRKLALLLQTNEYQLKFVLRRYYHTSLHSLFMEERLKKAQQLILQSGMNLKSVAMECGFTSYSHFSKVFKKRYGINPRQLQRSYHI